MPTKPATVEAYLAALPDDRREALQAVRKTILKNLPKGYDEGIQYGMIGYFVPHSVYPDGYHCDPKQPLPFAGLASQKNHMGMYLFCIYCDPEGKDRFEKEWKATGKKLDMGASCIRFKKIEDVPLDVLGATIKRTPVKEFIRYYEANTKRPTKKKPTTKKTSKKTAKKTAKKSIAQICRERGIKDTQYYKWKDIFLERSAEIFAGPSNTELQKKAERIAELERMVGKLAMENEALKKAKSWLD